MVLEWFFIIVASVFAGVVGSLVGGTSIILLPLLMMLGLPHSSALATSKLISSCANITSVVIFLEKSHIFNKTYYISGLLLLISSAVGAFITPQLDQVLVHKITGVLLIINGLIYFFDIKIIPDKILENKYIVGLFLIISGFYSSIIGLAMGPLYWLIGKGLYRLDNIGAIAFSRLMVVFVNIPSFLVFSLYYHNIDYEYGFPMLIASLIGIYVGTTHILKCSEKVLGIITAIAILGIGVMLLMQL